jgi:hypothetical protein
MDQREERREDESAEPVPHGERTAEVAFYRAIEQGHQEYDQAAGYGPRDHAAKPGPVDERVEVPEQDPKPGDKDRLPVSESKEASGGKRDERHEQVHEQQIEIECSPLIQAKPLERDDE